MWQAATEQTLQAVERLKKPVAQTVPAQVMVLVVCSDEQQQLQLLERFQAEALECKALLS
jgi:hypothetical protein